MNLISQNKCSAPGLIIGAIALIMGIFHFTMGPFSPRPPVLERIVAEQVSAVKRGVIAGIKGEKVAVVAKEKTVNIDKLLDNLGIGLAVVALICAFIGGMRKENRWSISGALLFGGGTLAFHALLFGIAVVCAILFLILVINLLVGGSVI